MTVHAERTSAGLDDIPLPEPSGTGFEDCLRAALSLGGLYIQGGLKEVDANMSDLFEVDILAHDFESGRSLAIEAKSGKVDQTDLWKLAGIVHYLDTSAGALATVKGAADDLVKKIESNPRLESLRIGTMEVHTCTPWKLLDSVWPAVHRLGFTRQAFQLGKSDEYDTWRYAFWCCRALTTRKGLDPLSSATRKKVQAWRKTCVENAPLTRDPLGRIQLLDRRFDEFGSSLYRDVAQELLGTPTLDDACFNDGTHPAVQHQLLVGLMSRLNVFASLIEAGRLAPDQLQRAVDERMITVRERSHIQKLSQLDDAAKIPELLLRFILCWGGFWTVAHESDEQEMLAAEADVDVAMINEAFAQFRDLFPQTAGFASLAGSIRVLKLVPAQLRGIGVHHRLRRTGHRGDFSDYVGPGPGAALSGRWLQSTRTLLAADRKPAGVTSTIRCCPQCD